MHYTFELGFGNPRPPSSIILVPNRIAYLLQIWYNEELKLYLKMDDRTANSDPYSDPIGDGDGYDPQNSLPTGNLAIPDWRSLQSAEGVSQNPVVSQQAALPPVAVKKGGLIADILANPRSGKLHEQRAYNYGLGYTKPALVNPVTVGGYTRDQRPIDYDIEAEARSAIPAIHEETIHCSVSGNFIDNTVFKEENILLEILQNAEPKDSKGTWFDLEFFAEGKWRQVTTEIGKFRDGQIEALRILDNGKGYMPKDMTTLGGGKRSDPESAGRFGSGMKISDRSALGRYMQVTRYSRNWRAEPFLEDVTTSAGYDKTVGYRVEYLPHIYPGSVVEYRNLTPGVIQAVRNINNNYLPLDKTFPARLLIHTEAGLILQPNSEGGRIMVNGRSYTLTTRTKHPLMFSYDLQNCTIDDQNRHYVDTGKATMNMSEIWEKTQDVELFKKIIKAAKEGPKIHEHSMPGIQATPTFRQAIQEYYKLKNLDTVYIDNGNISEKDKLALSRRGYTSINIGESRFMTETLAQANILSGKDLLNQITNAFYLNLDTAEFKGESFAATVCRGIFLLEKTAKEQGKTIEIKVLFEDHETGKVEEMTYGEFEEKSTLNLAIKTPTACRVTIKDAQINAEEGRHWVAGGHLSQPKWTKQFEPFIASCFVAGVQGYVHYKNYELSSGKSANRAVISIRDWPLRNEPHGESSDLAIVVDIENLNQAKDLRHLDFYSLKLNEKYAPFEKTINGDVVSLKEDHIYEEGIRRASKKYKCLLSYDLPQKAKEEEMWKDVQAIVALAKRPEIPRTILQKTKEEDDVKKYYMEYGANITDPEVKAAWVKAFEEVYGKDVVVYDLDKAHANQVKLVEAAAVSSGLKVVKLQPNLRATLVQCGVKTISSATQAAKIKEYNPNPLKEAFLEIAHVADAAIAQALGPFHGSIKPTIKLVESVENAYGQSIRTGQGYLDPTLSNRTIYMFADAVTNKNIDQVITFILNKKIEVYINQMSEDDYVQFRSRALGIAERSLTTINFMSRVRGKMFNKGENVADLIEVTLKEIERSEKDAEETVAIKRPKPKKEPLPLGEWTRGFGLKASKAATSLAILATLGGGLFYGGKFAIDTASSSEFLSKLAKKLAGEPEKDKKAAPKPRGFHRKQLANNHPIGVSVERSHAGGGEEDDETYRRHLDANFITTPGLSWGYFMSEMATTKYNGKSWEHDDNPPEFEDQHYEKQERFAHYQVMGDSKTATLRTRVESFIDPGSIKVLKGDGSLSDALIVRKLKNGEYEVKILDKDSNIVVYQTLSPFGWHKTADEVSNADFDKLDPAAYSYYTATPNIDLQKIRFKSEVYPQFTNVGEFVNFLKTLKPIDRVNTIRAVVGKMRYTITERTENAFRKFHNGELPEKDFFEFIMNSDELENPGDGDCDVQNSVFAIFARYAGVPTKLDFVFTEKGIGHGPASIFMPKIGWILFDTMGEKHLVENVVTRSNEVQDGGDTIKQETELEARQKLLDQIRRRTEYDVRKCYEVD